MHESPFPLKKQNATQMCTHTHTHTQDAGTQTGSALSECCSFVPPSLWFMGHCTTLGNNHIASAPPLIYSINLQKKKSHLSVFIFSHSLSPSRFVLGFFPPFPRQTSHIYPPERTGCKRKANMLVLMRKKMRPRIAAVDPFWFAWSLLPVSPPFTAFNRLFLTVSTSLARCLCSE